METNTVIKKVIFYDKICITLSSGDVLTIPYDYTSKLAQSKKDELKNYYLIGNGIGIHFDDIDEDISLNGIIRYKMENELLAS